MDALAFTFPIAKFEKLSDGRMLVEGVMTDESLDSQGDILDYEGSKKAIGAWRGNVREAHDPKKPVGKALDIRFDDDKKAVGVTVFVSAGAPETQKKIEDKILEGFSVGGSAPRKVAMEKIGDRRVRRVLEWDMSELSLVDVPANPSAMISLVKGNVATEQLAEAVELLPPEPPATDPAVMENRFAAKLLGALAETDQPVQKEAVPDPAPEPTKKEEPAAAPAQEVCKECGKAHDPKMPCEKTAVPEETKAAAAAPAPPPPPDAVTPQTKPEDEEKAKRLESVKAYQADMEKASKTKVQTLIFDKEKFPSAADAKKWAKDHDFKAGAVDETESSFRLRQEDPGKFKEKSFRTIGLKDGVKAVIGKPKGEDKVAVPIMAKHFGAGEEFDLRAALDVLEWLKGLLYAEEAEAMEESEQTDLLEHAISDVQEYIAGEAAEMVSENTGLAASLVPVLMKTIQETVKTAVAAALPADKGGEGFEKSDADALARVIGRGLKQATEPISKAVSDFKGVFDTEVKAIREKVEKIAQQPATVAVPAKYAPVGSGAGPQMFSPDVVTALEAAASSTSVPEARAAIAQQIAIAKAQAGRN